jgi:PAS domain S-box-containing protein
MLQKLVNTSLAQPRIGTEQWAGRISLTAGVGVAYFLIAELGLSLPTATEQVAVFWPASGVAVGILIAFGRWACAPVAVGVIVASAAAALLGDRSVWTALAFGFCNAGEVVLVMWLIERCFGTGFNLEFPREGWRSRVHPDDVPRLDALRNLAFAERRREHNTEYRIIGPEGNAQWIESRALISYDGDGRPIRIVGVQIDITERKRAQVALEESEARYRALYDDNPSMYFTLDASGTVLSVNEFGARQLGYTPAELVGQWVLRVVHEEDLEAARQHLGKCAENIETVVTAELRKVHRDGRIVWVREVARAVPAGQRAVLLIVCEDITERKRAEEQQSLLVAELDHRVKNVLASVAVVAMRTGERSGSKRDFIETLNHRLQSMADAHALLSRNRWQGVSLADLVGQELAPFATAGNTDVEGPHVALTAEATQALAMVLHELATNAAKYGALSKPQGRVSVRWEWCQPASLKLEWHEQGGPVVTGPAQAGYGTSVIRDLIPYELGGTVELKFAPDGVRCLVVIPDEQARRRDDVAHASTSLTAVR